MKAIDRLFVFFDHEGLKPTPIGVELGLTNGYLGKMRDRHGSIGSDILETICSKFPDLNPEWLITGRGSMLRTDSVQHPVEPTSVSAPSDTVALRLMDKLDAQESKIDQLQSELRQKSEELAVLKAKYQHPDEPVIAFTPGSSEAYTGSSLLTKKPITSSKKLSAGKTL